MTQPREMTEQPMMPSDERHVGFVGLAGVPNVGKSTLVNRLIGQKISIVSDRPQTTRERISGVYTNEKMQCILVDIPGILNARDRFNQALMDCAETGLVGCDLVLHMRDVRRPHGPEDEPVRELIHRSGKRAWLVWNKVDRAAGKMFPEGDKALNYERVFGISAKTGRGVDKLMAAVTETLPMGPLLYDADQICDRDMRFLAAEMVREKVFRYLGAEIPYSTAAFTEVFDEERAGKLFIQVTILTERDAHKPIIIGHKGAMLRKIGEAARREIENLCDRPVFLELWVKVRPKWRKNEHMLKELGLKHSV